MRPIRLNIRTTSHNEHWGRHGGPLAMLCLVALTEPPLCTSEEYAVCVNEGRIRKPLVINFLYDHVAP